jgi:hypothetical protein
MRKFIKRAVVIGAVVAITTGAGIAYASWVANGSGSASAKASTAQALSTVDASARAAAQLYPGGSGDVVVTLHNPNPYPVRVTSIVGNGAITASGAGSCLTTGVTFTAQSGSWDVAAGDDTEVTLIGAAHMSNASDNGCQGATFTIAVSLSGASNA